FSQFARGVLPAAATLRGEISAGAADRPCYGCSGAYSCPGSSRASGVRVCGRGGKMTVSKTLVLAGAVLCLSLLPLPAAAEEGSKVQAPSADGVKGKTWKTVDELSPEEKAMVDLRADTPRDAQIPYLPAEKFPFAAPYTAE